MDGLFTLANTIIAGVFAVLAASVTPLVPLIWNKYQKSSSNRKGVKSGAPLPVVSKISAWWIFLAGVVGFVLALPCVFVVRNSAAPQEDSVSMPQFLKEMDQAPFIAFKQHIGKRVTWEGYFEGSNSADCFALYLAPGTYQYVICFFQDDTKEELLTLRKGNKVTVSGILQSKETLRNCKILAVDKTDTGQVAEEASVTMAQYFRELDQEGAAPYLTLKRYVGKRVTWEGYFDKPNSADSFALCLSPDTYRSVLCNFSDDAKEELLTLRKGCKVKVSGILTSKDWLEQCKILAIEEAPPKAKEPKVK